MNPQQNDFEIRNALIRALELIIDEDEHLFKVGACERSLTFRLGLHLQDEIDDDWRVDSEYNKKGEFPKRLLKIRDQRRTGKVKSKSEGDVYPDLIVHRRGKDGSNRLAVETKRADQLTSKNFKADCQKLAEYQNELGYTTVAFVIFGVDVKSGPFVDVFFNLEREKPLRVTRRQE